MSNITIILDGNDSSKTNILDDLDTEEAAVENPSAAAGPSQNAASNPPPYTGILAFGMLADKENMEFLQILQ